MEDFIKVESWIDEVAKEYTEDDEICKGCGELLLEGQAIIKSENRHSACS